MEVPLGGNYKGDILIYLSDCECMEKKNIHRKDEKKIHEKQSWVSWEKKEKNKLTMARLVKGGKTINKWNNVQANVGQCTYTLR
jgi:hypothetical protein